MTRSELIDSFLKDAGLHDYTREPLTGDASSRRYERIRDRDGGTRILMDADPATGEQTEPFLRIRAHLYQYGFSAPAVFFEDPQNGFLLLEDFGDAVFASVMSQTPAQERPLYELAVDTLIRLRSKPLPTGLQVITANGLAEMIEPAFSFYAPDLGDLFPDAKDAFAHYLTPVADVPAVLSLRDFHAENMIYLPDRKAAQQVGLLDFQDAFATHPAYDLVSMLQDARRDLGPGVADHVIHYYLDKTGAEHASFLTAYHLLGAQRNLRILGIFSRLANARGKPQYLALQPRVWRHLQYNLAQPGLHDLKERLAPLPAPQEQGQ